MHKSGNSKSKAVNLKTPGGQLKVTFDISDKVYNNIWLIGPAEQVFKGDIVW
jgi:diaminopimelate epimerase